MDGQMDSWTGPGGGGNQESGVRGKEGKRPGDRWSVHGVGRYSMEREGRKEGRDYRGWMEGTGGRG